MPKRTLAPERRRAAKRLIGDCRRSRGLSVEELAELVGITAKSLQEFERPRGPCPGRPLYADICLALRSAEMMQLMLPPGWTVAYREPEDAAARRGWGHDGPLAPTHAG